MRKRDKTVPKAVHGKLDLIVEPNGENVWAFREEKYNGDYAAPRPLQKGEYLQVFNDYARKHEIWQGEVDLDFKAGCGPLPNATHICAQHVKGVGPVHGVQKDADPASWGDMFVQGKPATLVSRPKTYFA